MGLAKLRDRNRPIPGGLRFLQPETKWQPVPWSSFSTIVDGLVNHRRGNPYLAKQHGWKLAREEVEDEVDAYNAAICVAHGWTAYVVLMDGGQDPKLPSPLQVASRLVAGANVLREMFGTDGPMRDRTLANARARTCLACPKHDKGDWTRFFTQPAQAFVMKTLSLVKDLNLATDYDAELMVCTACYCPMKGKVWARLKHILANIPAPDKANLDASCWILAEEKETTGATPPHDDTPAT